MTKIIGSFSFFLVRCTHVILTHLLLHSQPDVIEFNQLLCSCGLVNGRGVRLGQRSRAWARARQDSTLPQQGLRLSANNCFNSLHALQDNIPRSHIQNVA